MSRLGRPSEYSDEFRRDAVELVRSTGRPISQVARELGMNHETLRNWAVRLLRPLRGHRLRADGVGCRQEEQRRPGH
ncbi:transposase [Saccharopolyspora shandongensis]|uniref:transposase n=1 Tax=Saccharopolyspora shandongensis TaxID=418495 RepID=UPI0033FA0EB3